MSYTVDSYCRMKSKAVADYKATRKLLHKIGQMKPQKADALVHELHYKEFDKIDCFECANCCKSISPAIYDSDIRRMAAALKLKLSEFIDTYVRKDEEDVYVFQKMPCPFLKDDNYCLMYESRPKACREYPHTDRKRIYQIIELTAKNSTVCPVVFNIVEKLKKTNIFY